VFVSSHLITETAQLADHVIVIGAGRRLGDMPVGHLKGSDETARDHGALEAAYFELTDPTLQYRSQQLGGGDRR
jgi:ABC-type Na+ transport system ATPase subunit NatA